jgi:hypothetical protein
MNPKDITLRKLSQAQKDKYCMISHNAQYKNSNSEVEKWNDGYQILKEQGSGQGKGKCWSKGTRFPSTGGISSGSLLHSKVTTVNNNALYISNC